MADPAIQPLLRSSAAATLLVVSLILQGCSSSADSVEETTRDSTSFDLITTNRAAVTVVEGASDAVRIPLQLNRFSNNENPITLSASGVSAADDRRVSLSFSNDTITDGNDQSELLVWIGIDALPIMHHQRTIIVSATDGEQTDEIRVNIDVQPTSAPDIYLLIGQSNMIGFSGDGTKMAGPGEPDEPNPRIKQLHVTRNDSNNVFTEESTFTNISANVVTPAIITAEDPLHEPLNQNTNRKDNDFIGLGISFARAALNDTTADVVLVPAAWSGTAFCVNDQGPIGQWNAQPTDNDPALGNTWLFDRAITRTDEAINQTGGVLRGILWHQGESDANEECAITYLANLERMVRQFRLRIKQDARGEAFRQPDAPIPFIAGTMSRGFDERGDLSVFNTNKQLIDDIHKTLPSQLSFAGTSVHDDLVGPQWPCGNTTCIHFGPEALRLIGTRYYEQLRSVMAVDLQ